MGAVSPMGAMPTMTAVPRLRSMSTAIRVVAPLPYASNAKCAPPPVSACTRATALSVRALTVCVAPNFVANADAGGDAAADERELRKVECGRRRDAARFGHDGVLGEARDLAHVRAVLAGERVQ